MTTKTLRQASTGYVYGTIVDIEVLSCCTCHIPFGVPEDMVAALRESHDTFYCPAGHKQHFPGKTPQEKEIERLSKERDDASRRLQWAQRDRDQALAESRKADYQARYAKGRLTLMRNRLRDGKCPVDRCTQTFADLHEHLHGVHPEFELPDTL